jgi:parvulin-like peptidyl-prolyl isomerase
MVVSLALQAQGGPAAPKAATGQVVDKVVASVDNQAITRSDVENAYGFELFLDGQAPEPPPDVATLEAVRDRLVDQTLLLSEAGIEGISDSDLDHPAAAALADIRKKFKSEEASRSALKSLGLSEEKALDRLRDRQRILTLIDNRLRPSARVELPEIETYYKNTFVPEITKRSKTPAPPLAEVEGQIREILTQNKIDELLSSWLESLKSSHRVSIHPF